MATSEVSLCNVAINMLGGETISSLTENVKAAKLCNVFYSVDRDFVLSDMWWTFATKRATLSRLVATPEFEFDYSYQLPSDLFQPQYVYATNEVEYKIEESTLITDETEVELVYTAAITDPTTFSEQFKNCLTLRLASHLALPLTNRTENQINFDKLYVRALARARTSDQNRDNIKQPTSSRWVQGRTGGSGRDGVAKKLTSET